VDSHGVVPWAPRRRGSSFQTVPRMSGCVRGTTFRKDSLRSQATCVMPTSSFPRTWTGLAGSKSRLTARASHRSGRATGEQRGYDAMLRPTIRYAYPSRSVLCIVS